MTVTATTVPLPDGRSLDVLVGGADHGLGLIAHHGTPSDATRFASWDEPAACHGLRLVTYSRPGYATSTRHPDRSVADAAADVTVLADALGTVDREALAAGAADDFAASIRRGFEHGLDGWVDDDLAFARPWGFELAAIERPVRIWQGELDRLVPLAHGRWLADIIPGARFVMAPGQGHLSLGDAHHDPILDDLVAAAEAAAG